MNPIVGIIFVVICAFVFIYSTYAIIKRRRSKSQTNKQDKAT